MQFKILTLRDRVSSRANYLVTTIGRNLSAAALATLALMLTPAGGLSQSPFSPAIKVNDRAVSWYELDQRTKFLELLGAPGDLQKLAREVLIEDRLKQQALAETEITVSDEQVEAGIAEFAARTELSPSQFIQALSEGGVSRETLRDFVEMGLLWREFAQLNFLDDARPTVAEIDRAFAKGKDPEILVLLSEIVIPVTPQTQAQAEELAEKISTIRRVDEFGAAAARFSAAQSRENEGKLEWLSLNKLPAGLHPMFLTMLPGEVSKPVVLPNAIAIFRMRAIREAAVPRPRYAKIDYASYYIPGGRSPEALAAAKTLRDRVDVCNDLYGVAQGQPADVLQRHDRSLGEIPRDVAFELAKMDPGESSIALTANEGQTLVFLMLCGRTTTQTQAASREDVAQALTAQRFDFLSTAFLDRLEADALIVDR